MNENGRGSGIHLDVIASVPLEATPTEAEDKYGLVARGANDGLWDWDLRADRVDYSPRWKALLGYAEHEIGDRPDEWLERVHPEDLRSLQAAIIDHGEGRTECLHHEHRLLHKDGAYRWMLGRGVAARDRRGRPYRLAGSLTDVSDRKATQARLRHEASHDALTGLPNRRAFLGVLERAMRHRTRRADYLFGVMHVGLDRFTVVNANLGHGAGDQLLVAVASRLQACVRPGDFVARIGGDEFAVLVNDIKDVADTVRVAERIQRALGAPFRIEGREAFTSASIGIAIGARDDRPGHLLRDARGAAERAKARGRARCEIFDPEMHAHAVTLLQLEGDLRGAFEREEFRLWYQPVVSLQTGQVLGFEALVRWMHPERGLVVPGDFVTAAEDSGLIVPLGWWALRQACRRLCAWKRFPHTESLFVSVNVSARQFQQPNLAEWVAGLVRESGVSPGGLKLEITESVLMDDPQAALALMGRLQGAGVRIAIDDFGTGYSSLSYLHRMPVHGLKIDRSFVGELDASSGATEIVRTILGLARTLGLEVVAEGVETLEQAARLRALGCEQAQGFLFGKPMDGDAASALLSRAHPSILEPEGSPRDR